MQDLINIIQIALFIILPLILIYQKKGTGFKTYVFYIPGLYILWYLSYAVLHELSHYIGALITGAEVIDYKFFPRFWKGDFGSCFIKTNYTSKSQEFFIVVLAYLRDIIFLLIGYIFLKRKEIRNLFLLGLILVIFIFSPLYDIINNYTAFLFGALNDFNAIRYTTSNSVAHFIGIMFSVAALIINFRTYQIIVNKK